MTPSPQGPPTLSVIIPAFNAAATLEQTLIALTTANPPPAEILVVNDGSTDATGEIAQRFAVRVITSEQNIGAARAKNLGARRTRGDILFFTDADIVPPADALALVARALTAPDCAGIVGLLDENGPYPNWASQFKNLWMNFTYARFIGADRIGLFYTSAAAIRREDFLQLGGFDENYRGASIAEDTEFGQRAWGANYKLVLEPQLRVTHLKAYTLDSLLKEDFKRARALTLMRLRKRGEPFFTSVPLSYQLAVPLLYLTLILLLVALVLQNSFALALAVVALVLFYLVNLSFLHFLFQKRGLLFALRSALFLPIDVFIVGTGMAAAIFDFARGIHY